MGYYIPNDKPVQERGAEPTSLPASFNDIPEGKALICEVDNRIFKANALVFSQGEYEAFTLRDDIRPKRWFLMEKDKAHELSGYKQN